MDWPSWLTDPVVTVDGEGSEAITAVTGTVRDQAALFGLVSIVRDLGVTLIALERISRSQHL